MITYVAPKKRKISTILTATSGDLWLPITSQLEAIAESAQGVNRVIVAGPNEPKRQDGVKWIKTPANPPIRNLLGSYMMEMPGSEVVAICTPDMILDHHHGMLLDMVWKQKFDLSWSSFACNEGARTPKLFVMSAAIVPHIMADIKPELTMAKDWTDWLHTWMKRMMPPHRYLDATGMGLIREVVPPVMNAYDQPPIP